MKLEVNFKKKSGKLTDLWRINTEKTSESKKKPKRNIKNTLREMKRQHTKIYGIPQKIILKGKLPTINAYIKKQEKS